MEDMMRADTQAISIEAPPDKIVSFLADGRNLSRWAVGFAKSVTPNGKEYVVTTSGGDVRVRIGEDRQTGVVDFWIAPAPGVDMLAASRVIPRGQASEVVFTQFQAPGMSDEVFEASIKAVGHELLVLKSILEVECPL
jgi:hypothetical protein